MKKILNIFIVSLLLINSFVFRLSADIGPKPSVTINFINAPDEPYYVTLLSSVNKYGPWNEVVSEEFNTDDSLKADAYKAFKAYSDNDDFYFLDYVEQCNDNNTFSWSYYPPSEFKIAIYSSKDKTLKVSEVIKRVAFDSYYEVTYGDELIVKEKIELGNKLLMFLLRVVLTILIELVIGLIFGYRSSKERKTIIITNLITQILLNIAILLFDYYMGLLVWIFIFPILEIVVTIIEAIVYLAKFKDHKKFKTIIYSLIANLCTCLLGMYTSFISSV